MTPCPAAAGALSRAAKADTELSEKLHDAELQASFNSAENLGFDELIDPRETRTALLSALQRGLYTRQAAAQPVLRTAILP